MIFEHRIERLYNDRQNTSRMIRQALVTIFLILITTTLASAQVEMADSMRSNGKIYVVVIVLATIFAGIFAYLVSLDRKISKLEKENKS